MDEFLEQFLIESRELVASASQDLSTLENSPDDKDSLDALFRAFHTLKGGAGIVDFDAMGRALHAAEDVLTAVRSGRRVLTSLLAGDLLACLDQVARWLDATESTGELPAGVDAQADAVVESFSESGAHPERPKSDGDNKARATAHSADVVKAVLDEQARLLMDARADGRQGRWSSAARIGAKVLRQTGHQKAAQDLEHALAGALESGAADGLAKLLTGTDLALDQSPAKIDTSPRTFRVEAARLDELVNLAGELSVAKNAIGHLSRVAQETNNPLAPVLRDQYANIDKLVDGLQQSVLGMRVIPVRHLFQRFQRLAREMSAALNKPARLVTSGEETEADKAVIEALYEPLLHLLRNAMDHGIEETETRRNSGKPESATITLRASRQNEFVIVEVADDGGGIDIARVRQRAAERGIGTAEDLKALGDAEVVDLIFQPGFSTASKVTETSGRGVGMDAVRTALARLGGRVTVESATGKGSTIRLTLPFSVLMTQVMVVGAGGQNFGIPLDAVVETIRVPWTQIQDVGTARALVHRHRTLPIIGLARLLGREAADQQPSVEITLVIVTFGGHEGAFEVDRLGDRVDIMLKPMSGLLKGTPGVSGTTMLGDGSVLIVLDVEALLS